MLSMGAKQNERWRYMPHLLLENFDAKRRSEKYEYRVDIEIRMRLNRFLRPEVPGFWPSKGFVGTSFTVKDMVWDEWMRQVSRLYTTR